MELVNTSDLVQISTTGAMKFNFKKADNEFPLILFLQTMSNKTDKGGEVDCDINNGIIIL